MLTVLNFRFLVTLYLIDSQETIVLKAKSTHLVASNFINLVEVLLKLFNLVELKLKLIVLVALTIIVRFVFKKPNFAGPL